MAYNFFIMAVAEKIPKLYTYAYPISLTQQEAKEKERRLFSINIKELLKPVSYTQLTSNIRIDIVNRINSFSTLAENWDGYGASAPSANVINKATSFFNSLPRPYKQILNVEDIYPSTYGTIILEWYNKEHFISIEIGETKFGFFSEVKSGSNPFHKGIEYSENIIDERIISVFEQLFNTP